MKADKVFKPFDRAVINLQFRLLPSAGATPWALAFPPQDTDDSLSPVSTVKHSKHSLIDPISDDAADELFKLTEGDISEIEADLEKQDTPLSASDLADLDEEKSEASLTDDDLLILDY